jgi:hypothetical protein
MAKVILSQWASMIIWTLPVNNTVQLLPVLKQLAIASQQDLKG